MHGDQDDVVPISISRGYAERAVAAGDRCELVDLPGVGHDEHLEPAEEAWQAVVRWLEEQR